MKNPSPERITQASVIKSEEGAGAYEPLCSEGAAASFNFGGGAERLKCVTLSVLSLSVSERECTKVSECMNVGGSQFQSLSWRLVVFKARPRVGQDESVPPVPHQ